MDFVFRDSKWKEIDSIGNADIGDLVRSGSSNVVYVLKSRDADGVDLELVGFRGPGGKVDFLGELRGMSPEQVVNKMLSEIGK